MLNKTLNSFFIRDIKDTVQWGINMYYLYEEHHPFQDLLLSQMFEVAELCADFYFQECPAAVNCMLPLRNKCNIVLNNITSPLYVLPLANLFAS